MSPSPVIPPKLGAGSHVRVIAPSTSMAALPQPWREIADARMADLGLAVSFGERVWELDDFESSSVASRLADLHEAFADPAVDGVLTFIGGYLGNQLLSGLDMDLIREHPKVFCGYSDITVLQHAMLTGADLVTYSGPHWSSFGMKKHLEETVAWFRACVFEDEAYEVRPAPQYTDDAWFMDQDDRHPEPTTWWVLQPGGAEGRLLGGNLGTLALLQGTTWWPSLDGAIVVVEDDFESSVVDFARSLQSLLHQPGQIAGLVIGRFQKATKMTRELLAELVGSQPELRGVPVVANVDVGHTNPFFTYPVGGEAALFADEADPRLRITRH